MRQLTNTEVMIQLMESLGITVKTIPSSKTTAKDEDFVWKFPTTEAPSVPTASKPSGALQGFTSGINHSTDSTSVDRKISSNFTAKAPDVFASYKKDIKSNTLDIVSIVHAFNKENPKGGVTIAYRQCEYFKNSKMVEVTAVYCSEADSFSRKIGTKMALNKFAKGETMLVPARINGEKTDVPVTLRNMFWYSLIY